MSNLSEMFKLYCWHNHLELRKLAPVIGVSVSTLSRFQNGKSITSTNFIKLLVWLNDQPNNKLNKDKE